MKSASRKNSPAKKPHQVVQISPADLWRAATQMMKDDGCSRGVDPSNYFPDAYDGLQKADAFLKKPSRPTADEGEMAKTKSGMLESYFLPCEVFEDRMPPRSVRSTLPDEAGLLTRFNEMSQASSEEALQEHKKIKDQYFMTLGSWKALQKAVRDLEAAGAISAEDSKRICNQRGLWAADIELIAKARRQIVQRRQPVTADEIVAYLPVGEELSLKAAWQAIRLQRPKVSKTSARKLLDEAVEDGKLMRGSNYGWLRKN